MIRKGVDIAMRMMGEQFVTGQTIDEALAKSRQLEASGFRYSYDMLGEAATTAEDAARYFADYERRSTPSARLRRGAGIYEGPGISIKLRRCIRATRASQASSASWASFCRA